MGLPTNVVDAAASIKDRKLGFTEISIGDLVVSALQELSGDDEVIITERPVEEGFNIIEAAVHVPKTRVLGIVLGNPDFSVESGVKAALNGSVTQFTETWRDKRDRLYEIKNGLEIVNLTTHEEHIKNMMIQKISPWYDIEENWEAFVANVTMEQIDIRQLESADSLLGAMTAGLKSVGGM